MKSCCAPPSKTGTRSAWKRVLWFGVVIAAALSVPAYALTHASAESRHVHSENAATVYACPMHPDVTSDKPGVCPKCGMKLEPRPAPKP